MKNYLYVSLYIVKKFIKKLISLRKNMRSLILWKILFLLSKYKIILKKICISLSEQIAVPLLVRLMEILYRIFDIMLLSDIRSYSAIKRKSIRVTIRYVSHRLIWNFTFHRTLY